jgi:hypothetical protein
LGNASEQVLIEALPPILVLHLNRVRYDVAAGGIAKIGKSIQLAPELEIPLGAIFNFLAVAEANNTFVIWPFQTSWYPMLKDPQSHRITSSMEYSTITANLQAADTLRLMSSAREKTATLEKFGCTSMMRQ